MIEFHKIWIDQCEGARGIKEQFGTEKALGYLIGEKLVNFIRASDRHPEFAAELPKFVAEVKRIFEPQEIREYLENIRRVGAFGHVCTDEEVEVFRAAGAIDEDPVWGAEDVLIVERIKEMLLE
ncbi:MAG: hypothetical protein HY652_01495 [Acidobacteria bacterium]|nr:hypothetical protein [Acidobacteriota bacterium]